MNLRRRSLIVAAPALLGAPAWVCANVPEKSRLVVSVDGRDRLYYLPLRLAEQLGYFKSEGVDLRIVDYSGGAHALRALRVGDADGVACAFEHVIRQQLHGQPLRAVALMGRAPQIVLAISPKRMPKFATLADLKGRRIGVTAPGSSSHLMVKLVLAQAGVAPDEVRIVGVGAGVGAIANIDPVISRLQRSIGLHIVVDTRVVADADRLYGGPMPAACLALPQAFINHHPLTVQAGVNAIVRANQWIQAAAVPEIMAKIPRGHLPGDRAAYVDAIRAAKGALSPDGIFPDDAAATALRAVVGSDAAFAGANVDLTATFSNEFALVASAKTPRG